MFTASDLIRGATRGTAAQATAYLTRIGAKVDFIEVVTEVYRVAPLVGLDAGIVIAQMAVETDYFRSLLFVRDGNTGGLGIDGDNTTTYTTTSPFQRLRGKQAALVHMATLWIKLYGPKVILPEPLKPAEALAIAWLARVRRMAGDTNWPKVERITDLNIHFRSVITGDTEATWAWDETYQDTIVARANAIFPGAPDWKAWSNSTVPAGGVVPTLIIYGRVPHPPFVDKPIIKRAGHGQDNLGKREVYGIVLHRMLGTLEGTNTYFREDEVEALTDYGIGTTYTDGFLKNGKIYRWNNPRGYQSGWASGPVKKPYGDGLRFVNQYGINAVNRFQASVEVSGIEYDDPITQEVKRAIAAIIAYWADQRKISWITFPIGPEGYSFVRWHQEFTLGSGKICPGSVIMDATNESIEMARAIMKQYQTGFPKKREKIVGALAFGMTLKTNPKNRYKCIGGMWGRTAPSLKAPKALLSMFTRGRIVTFDYSVEIDGVVWLASKGGTWVLASKFEAVGR